MALTGVLPAVHGCWVAESPATGVLLTGGRYTHVDGAVVGLQVHEDHVEQYAQQLYEALRERVIELKGYTPEELEPMLDKQCAGAARERRDSALQLLDRSDEFLLHQVLFPCRPCGAQRAPFLPVFTVCCEAFCCDLLGDKASMIFKDLLILYSHNMAASLPRIQVLCLQLMCVSGGMLVHASMLLGCKNAFSYMQLLLA